MKSTDTDLIFENYKAINVKQLMLESTVESFARNTVQIDTLSEAYAILDIYNDMLEEGLFSNIKNAYSGAKNVAQGVGNTVRAVGGAVQRGAKAVASGVRHVAGNVSNMYDKGKKASQVNQVMSQAAEAAQQIKDLIAQAKQLSPETFQGSSAVNPDDLTLGAIINYMTTAGVNSAVAADAAQQNGVFGGVGGAMKQGFQGQAAPVTP
jgi:methyl-accepting chemotaxis protein